MLKLAAVIGRTFLYRVLQNIATADRELDHHLAQLQSLDLSRLPATLVPPRLKLQGRVDAQVHLLGETELAEMHRLVGDAARTVRRLLHLGEREPVRTGGRDDRPTVERSEQAHEGGLDRVDRAHALRLGG